MAWVALVPFFLALYQAASFKQALLSGFVAGFVFFGGLLGWILVFGKLAWTSLTTFMALYVCLFAGGAYFIAKKGRSPERLFLISAWWVAVELVRSIGPWGFSWGILGASQQNLAFLQVAKIVGSIGLSYFIVLINLLIIEVWKGRQNLRSIAREVAIVFLIIILVLAVGQAFLKQKTKSRLFEVAAVQSNIPQDQKFDSAYRDKVKKTYLELTEQAARAHPYLIVWPESAVPGYLRDEPGYQRNLSQLARQSGSYLLIGSLDWRGNQDYNSVFLMSPQGRIVGRYDQMHLVPFGQFVPCRPVFGRIRALAAVQSDLSIGQKPVVFKTEKGDFSTLICFESTSPFLARRLVRQGAGFLIAVANDGWFGHSAAARQHLELTRLRAIENGVYTVQAANTGLSALIDPWGRIKKVSPLLQKKVLIGMISFIRQPTFYNRAGDTFAYLCLIGSLVSIAIFKWGKKKEN